MATSDKIEFNIEEMPREGLELSKSIESNSVNVSESSVGKMELEVKNREDYSQTQVAIQCPKSEEAAAVSPREADISVIENVSQMKQRHLSSEHSFESEMNSEKKLDSTEKVDSEPSSQVVLPQSVSRSPRNESLFENKDSENLEGSCGSKNYASTEATMDVDDPSSPRSSPFNEEYEKFLGGKSQKPEEDVRILSDDDNSRSSTSTKSCSVKLVNINEMIESGEPLAKKPRTSEQLPRNSSGDLSNLYLCKSNESEVKKEVKSPFSFGGNVDSTMKLFGSKRESKVTISPVRSRDVLSNSSSTTPAMGSVTITKLSTGSSLSVESKDLKSILGTSKTEREKKLAATNRTTKSFENGFRLANAKLDVVPVDVKYSNSKVGCAGNNFGKGHQSRSRHNSGDSSIRCNKCREVYSTKEARRLHTCNSILDQHFLIEGENRLKISPSSSKDSSDNSRSSSRADSPLSHLSPSGSSTPVPSSAPPQGFGSVKKIKITASSGAETSVLKTVTSSTTTSSSTSVKCKLIKDSKDELHIEGRPKLSIVKVPRLECGGGAIPCTGEKRIVLPPPPGSQSQPIVPKLKLTGLPLQDTKRDSGKEKWHGGANSKDPLNLGETFSGLKSHKVASSETLKKMNTDEKSNTEQDSSDKIASSRKVEMVSASFGSSKIRIKYGGAPHSESLESCKPEEKESADDGFPFTFSGRPSYSPSRVEPNGSVQPTKESPRDASSKDSPASQADSGVFSIASSNSPSKDVSVSADGNSPDSNNRDRMTAFSEQSYMQWKSGQTDSGGNKQVTPPLASPFSNTSSNQSCGSGGNQNPSLNNYPIGHGSHNNQGNPNMMFSQHQIQRQQQMHQHFMNRMPGAESEFGMYPGDQMKGGLVNNPYGQHPTMGKMAGGPGMPPLQQQRQMYPHQMFGFPEPEPKKKRGRPRKNEVKEPGTKRPYKRKPKVLPPQPGQSPSGGEMSSMGSMGPMSGSNQPPVGARLQQHPNMPVGGRQQPQMGNVYNFEDEEGNEDLGPIMSRRPPVPAQGQKGPGNGVHHMHGSHGGMMSGRPPQGSGPYQQYNHSHQNPYQQHNMSGVLGNQLMSAVHQKPTPMGIGTIAGMGSIRQGNMGMARANMHHHQQQLQQQQQQQQQQLQHHQQQHQHQQNPLQHQSVDQQHGEQQRQESGQSQEEDCRYSSELLTNEKTGGIGIKIKIKKAADSNASSQNSSNSNSQQHTPTNVAEQSQQKQAPKSVECQESALSEGRSSCENTPISSMSATPTHTPAVSTSSPMSMNHDFRQNSTPTSTCSTPVSSGSSSVMPPISVSSSVPTSNSFLQQTPPQFSQSPQQNFPMGLGNNQSNSGFANLGMSGQQQVPSPMAAMGPRPPNVGHPSAGSPMRSPFSSSSSPSQNSFGGMHHGPAATPYRFGNPQQQQMGGSMASQVSNPQHMGNPVMQQQMGMGTYNNFYNQGMNPSFGMQQQPYPQGGFQGNNMNMPGGSYGVGQPYRYGMPNNGQMYGGGGGGYGQYGMAGSNGQFSEQYQNQFANQHQTGMYGNTGNMYGMAGYNNQQRMMGSDMMSQQHFRQQSMMAQQQIMGGHSPHMNPNNGMGMMPGGIGQPRMSPSAMHKPMPGVGLVNPSVNSSQPSRLQTTPLVSPQSMHSVAEQSPVSSMHNQPLTPGNSYGGPSTPQSCNPMTPMAMGMTSPMTPHGQNQMHQPVHQNNLGYQQQSMMSPMPQQEDLRSPLSNQTSASNLRKIRRPSKSSYKDENMSSPKGDEDSNRLADFGEFVKEEEEFENQQRMESSNDADFKREDVTSPMNQSSTGVQDSSAGVEDSPIVKEEKIVKEEPKVEPEIKEEVVTPVKEEPPEPVYEARWEELDEKILKKIFQFCNVNDGTFLVKASRVSGSWFRATQDPKLWTHLDLSQGRLKEKYRNDKKLEWFLKKYPNVLEIKLGGWKNSVSTSTIRLIAQHCPNLISLGLSGCLKLTNEDLKIVGDSFPRLERIDLSGVSPSSCSSRSAVSSTCLSDFIATLGPRLTHFGIANNKMSGLPFVFKALSTHSTNLEVLDISNITTTSRDTILINIEKFQKGCQKLRVFNANHTMLSLSDTPIKEQVLSPGFPNLHELYIAVDNRGYFDGMDDTHIERILKKSASLKLLDIRGCQHVTESCLIRLPTWDLERLVVAGCSAAAGGYDGLELVVRKWAHKLIDIDISLTTGRAVNNAIDAFSETDNVQLRKLNLCGSAVNMKSLTRLLKNCPTLEYINLSSCRGLPRGMKRLYSTPEAVRQLSQDVADGKFSNDGDDSDD